MPLSQDAQDLLSQFPKEETNTVEAAPTDAPQLSGAARDLLNEYKSEDYSSKPSISETLGTEFVKSFGTGTVSNVLHDLEARYPTVMGALNEGGLDSVYGEGFSTTTDQGRREMIIAHNNEVKGQLLEKWYGSANPDTSAHPIASLVGGLGGSLMDPTTLAGGAVTGATIPARLYSAAKIGAVWGGLQGASEGLAEKGSIDPVKTAETAALGAVTGAVLQGAIVEPLEKVIQHFRSIGRPVTPDDIQNVSKDLPGASEGVLDTQKAADIINEQQGLHTDTPEAAMERTLKDAELGSDEGSFSSIDHTYLEGKADQLISGDPDWKQSTRVGGSREDILAMEPVTSGGEEPKKLDVHALEPLDIVGPLVEPNEKTLPLWKVERNALDVSMQQANDLLETLNKAPEVKDNIIKSASAEYKSMSKAMDADSLIIKTLEDNAIPHTDPLAQSIESSDITPIKPPPDEPPNGGGDGGNYKSGDPLVPNPDDPNYKAISQKFHRERWVQAPEKAWRSIKGSGEMATRLFENYKVKSRQMRESKLVDYDRILIKNKIKIGSDEERLIRKVLNKSVDADSVPANIRVAANDTRVFMNKTLDQFEAQGLLTKERVIELKKQGVEEGYFHRMYDRAKLSTDGGKQQFIDALSGVAFKTDKQAEIAARSLVGEKNKGNLLRHIRNDNGVYRVSPKLAEHFWAKSNGVNDGGVSSFVERARSIPPEFEQALDPFLIQDTRAVMAQYIQDTSNRLVSAKYFGNNHDVAKAIFSQMYQKSPERAESFIQTMWQEFRDPRSKNIQSFTDRSEVGLATARILRATQAFKLTFSQLTNLTQLPVNGALLIAHMEGLSPSQKLGVYIDGLYKGWAGKMGKAEFAEEAQIAGATADNIWVDIMGHINDSAHSIIPRKLIGPFEVFNNPSLFLKYTGFSFTEDVNRIGAYHMGKGYVENLLLNKSKLEALGNRANPKKLEGVYKALEELGISRYEKFDQVSLGKLQNTAYKIENYSDDLREAILQGGQRFSNNLNFVNDIHKLPLFASSFWGKIMFQLHTFAFHQMNLATERALKPAIQFLDPRKSGGTLVPLMVYLGVGTAAGMPLAAFKRMLFADDTQLTTTEAILNAQTSVAGFGLMQDMIKSAQYGKQGVLSQFAGPGLSTVADLAAGVGSGINVAQSNFDKTGNPLQGKNVVQPLTKAVLRNIAFPYKKEAMKAMQADKETFDERFWRQQGKGVDFEKSNKKLFK